MYSVCVRRYGQLSISFCLNRAILLLQLAHYLICVQQICLDRNLHFGISEIIDSVYFVLFYHLLADFLFTELFTNLWTH